MRKLLLLLALSMLTPDSPIVDVPLGGDLVDRGKWHLQVQGEGVEVAPDRHGNARGACHFGSSSYLELKPARQIDHVQEFTLSAWIQPQQHREHNSVISKVTPSRDFNLQLNVEGRLVAHINSGVYEFAYSERRLPLQRWSHVAATFQNRTWKLYIQGQLDSTHPVQQVPLWQGQYLTIGNLYPGSSEGFLGNLDDVRMYARAFNAREILELSRQ
ncbi:MAG: LamG domain-containing protein [Candidatus Eremiobacteraeota bacterium]|nr:LamG domain-containing protein [Candidatus Eremiobacteraeota bacterium]